MKIDPMRMVLPCLLLFACSSPPPPLEAESPAPRAPTAAATPFCQIETWGPQQVRAGARFNEREDGYSAFWFRGTCSPGRVMLDFDGRLIETTAGKQGFTASFNADGVLQRAGRHALGLYDPATRARMRVGELQVEPAREGNALPRPPPRQWPAPATTLQTPVLIAHAGGGWRDRRYLNSKEALDNNYALGHRMFELDFAWTRDEQLVAIHDWKDSWRRLFPDADHASVPDHASFLSTPMIERQTPLDLARLRAWLEQHPDAHVVTDTRGRNLYMLQHLKAALGPLQDRIIPQMYHAHRYPDIRALGYEQIIFTLYGTALDTDSLLDFIRATPLFAVTLNPGRPDAERLLRELSAAGIPVYVHTYNDPADLPRFRALGAHGLYTDFLYLDAGGALRRQGR